MRLTQSIVITVQLPPSPNWPKEVIIALAVAIMTAIGLLFAMVKYLWKHQGARCLQKYKIRRRSRRGRGIAGEYST